MMTAGGGNPREREPRWPAWLPWTGAIVVLLAVFGLWLSRGALVEAVCAPLVEEARGAGGDAAEGPASAGGRESPAGSLPEKAATQGARRAWQDALGGPPIWPEDLADPLDCEAVEDDLAKVCVALDEMLGRAGTVVDGGGCDLLVGAGDDLAGSLPVAHGETRRLQSLLDNVVHMARVLGTERVVSMAAVARESGELAEPLAMTLFRHAASRARCAPRGSVDHEQAAYEYAVFLLNTVGGQAYLARRPARQAALARFYALVAIERAQGAGHDPHGFDARPHIARCRELIEGQPLVFRERYLRILDDQLRRWREP
ncbi:MAG: hypothetical protein OEQ13_03170 [Acidobacteriota bacterium]|nr:hypothetical protein [Acidobacteriota bacterium]